jgi:CRISPR-associated protein Cmr2
VSAATPQRLLHFTLGPVQGFVAQARRTRDLWAGSFLLSWLAGQAMAAVEAGGGKIVLPAVNCDPLLAAIRERPGGFGPAVGSLPNRFKARVPDRFDPHRCQDAIDAAWQGLARPVWERSVAHVAHLGRDTQEIWERQVAGFWDVAWVTGADPGDGSDGGWLDRRKNWRTYRPPVEDGDHCTLMGDWQELSGYVRAREKSRQDAFWAALREQLKNPLDLDEQGRERLCTMALIKRLFLEVAAETIGWTPSWDGHDAVRWPSTPRLAAAGWLGHSWRKAPQQAAAFVAEAGPTKRAQVEPPLAPGNTLSRVAGQLLHRSGIENARADELDDADRKRLIGAHTALTRQAGRSPSAFYTLLLMDGDSVGTLLRCHPERKVATALAAFASAVEKPVQKGGGYLVYAGGDDLLVLLPIEGALTAAITLRDAYGQAFADAGIPEATTSAALVFAHWHVPLRQVLREAHARLKKVAKDGNDRDSLAVCVLSQGGVLRQWVSGWQPPGSAGRPPQLLDDLPGHLEQVAGRFFYKVRETWGDVLAPTDANDKAPTLFSRGQIQRVLVAELLAGERPDAERLEQANALVRDLLILAQRWPGGVEPPPPRGFDMDGPLLARFLGQERCAGEKTR